MERVRHEASTIKRVETLLKSEDKAGAFLWPFFRDIFLYAAERIPEITDESYQIDRAMRWGFNWEFGPFELWQELGVEEISKRIRQDGKVLPEWVEELQKQESKCFYRVESDHQEFFSIREPVNTRS